MQLLPPSTPRILSESSRLTDVLIHLQNAFYSSYKKKTTRFIYSQKNSRKTLNTEMCYLPRRKVTSSSQDWFGYSLVFFGPWFEALEVHCRLCYPSRGGETLFGCRSNRVLVVNGGVSVPSSFSRLVFEEVCCFGQLHGDGRVQRPALFAGLTQTQAER